MRILLYSLAGLACLCVAGMLGLLLYLTGQKNKEKTEAARAARWVSPSKNGKEEFKEEERLTDKES